MRQENLRDEPVSLQVPADEIRAGASEVHIVQNPACGSADLIRRFAAHFLFLRGIRLKSQNLLPSIPTEFWIEIGVTNRICTGTNAFTGRDAAVTS